MLLRYPGGKSKLKKFIVGKLSEISDTAPRQYREPFFGGGSVGLGMLDHPNVNTVWINDIDPCIAALWTAIAQRPDQLIGRIEGFVPSVNAYDTFKDELLTLTSVPAEIDALVDIAFKKLALHRMSFSGLGTMSGGPLGGRPQLSMDKIDSRWKPSRLCREINEIHSRFAAKGVTGCTCLDFTALIEDKTCDCNIYLDPPYVEKGGSLYQYALTEQDHVRLAECLRKTPHPWVLSYDDSSLVHDLYSWAHIEKVVGYSVSSVRRTKELLITPPTKGIVLPSKVQSDSLPYVLVS